MSKAAISLIQTGLRDLGYAPGPIDGLFGAKTSSAAHAWLVARGAAAAQSVKPMTVSSIYQGSAKYPVDEICIHCAATVPGWMADSGLASQIAEIRSWHLAKGWKDIGYHWIIGRDGKILPGRAETVIGAGVEGHNSGVIHICLIGGHGSSENDAFTTNFTAAQGVSLRQLITGISMRTRIQRISGHNEYAAKACPGFNVTKWLKEAV